MIFIKEAQSADVVRIRVFVFTSRASSLNGCARNAWVDSCCYCFYMGFQKIMLMKIL